MQQNRSFDDVFSSLRNILKQRNLEDEKNKPNSNIHPKCLCGRNEYSSYEDNLLGNTENNDEDSEENNNDPIYIEKTPRGLVYAVCPSCNPRLNCYRCEGTGNRKLPQKYLYETIHGEKFEYFVENLSPGTCACMHTERLVAMLNHADIPDKYKDVKIESLQFAHLSINQQKKLQENLQKLILFTLKAKSIFENKELLQKKYFMTLLGPVGSGKTLLACIALKKIIIDYHVKGRFIDFQFLLSKIKSEYEQKRSGENIMNELRDVDVLVIDEFGKGRNENEWQLEKLDDLVNYRYNNQKITIITTNYLPPNFKYDEKDFPRSTNTRDTTSAPVNESFWTQNLLERVGARIYERLLEVSEFIDFLGIPSYRKQLGKSFLDIYTTKSKI